MFGLAAAPTASAIHSLGVTRKTPSWTQNSWLIIQSCKRKKRSVAEALLDEQWIRDVAYDLTVPLLDEFVQLWELIDAANFDANNTEADTIVWTRTASEEYSAKSAYM